MGGDHEGAACLRVFLHQSFVEELPGDHVEARYRLVQEGERCLAGQGHGDGHGREHPLVDLAHSLFRFDLEGFYQPVGQVLIPLGIVEGSSFEIFLDFDAGDAAVSCNVQLPGEAELVESLPAFPNRLAVQGDGPSGSRILGRQDREQSRLARSVPSDQAVDFAGFQGQVDVPQGFLVLVVLGDSFTYEFRHPRLLLSAWRSVRPL